MKKILAILLALLLLAAAAGCGPAQSEQQEAAFSPSMDTGATADIEIVGKLDNFEALEAVIKDFNAVYPNVTVSYSKMDNYNTVLADRVLGSDPPEIFMSLRSYFEINPQLLEATLDLSDAGLDTGIIDPEVIEGCTKDGKLVRLPLMLNYQGIAVNTSLLEKEGLKIPQTYDEFISTCDALVSKGYTPLQGFPDTIYAMLLFNEWRIRLSQEDNAGEIFEQLNAGADGCGSYLEKSFEILEDYRERGYYDAAVNDQITDSYDAAILHFFEGNTPFLVCSAEAMSGMKKRETKSEAFTASPFAYEFTELPVSDAGANAVVDIWSGFSVVKNSANVLWAEEFMRFLCTADELNKMASVKGMPTAVRGGNADARYADLEQLGAGQKKTIGAIGVSNAVSAAYADCAKKIGTGACTAQQAADGFAAAVQAQLGK
ncbi:MAG: ABC transporter substrate-binding protein [Oscillospiraceae bacterium]|nr:ABC transporter substrate-binding protein [Oscillospiraceae bacterium]